jgi:glycerol uptake facilitator-like aquaporin
MSDLGRSQVSRAYFFAWRNRLPCWCRHGTGTNPNDADSHDGAGFAPIAIGLCLTAIHLVSIPVTNTSVNPRSTGPALFVGEWALGQLWLFWVAPLVGAGLAGVVYRALVGEGRTDQTD